MKYFADWKAMTHGERVRVGLYSILTAMAFLLMLLVLAGCSPKKTELPKTELPKLPASATLDCENLTDEEIIQCIKNPKSRDICRKLEINCVRYDNLKAFTKRTWAERDKK